jgi:hypothetical protein
MASVDQPQRAQWISKGLTLDEEDGDVVSDLKKISDRA